MKNILVPIDFSKVSENALDYAVELAQRAKAKITLMHVYISSVYVSDVLYMLPSPEEMEKGFMRRMEKMRKAILKKHPQLEISCHCKSGIIAEEVESYAGIHEINLIIIGTQGANYLTERILGSTATTLIRTSFFPIMTIDHDVHFKDIGKILLATDFIEMDTTTLLNPLKEIVKLFEAHLCILNIVRKDTIESSDSEISAGFKLNHELKHIHRTFFYSHHEDIVEGINEFAIQHKMDMIVMIPHHHSIMSRLFTEPQTHKMAFHSKVPLLTLH